MSILFLVLALGAWCLFGNMGLRGGYKSETSLECERLGLNYKRVVSCAYRRQITKQQAIDYCLELDGKK
jgi:hypothetical protein